MEADRLLSAHELVERVCSAFECPHYEHLSIPKRSLDYAPRIGRAVGLTKCAFSWKFGCRIVRGSAPMRQTLLCSESNTRSSPYATRMRAPTRRRDGCSGPVPSAP